MKSKTKNIDNKTRYRQQEISISELIDIPSLQNLFDSFYKLTGMPTAILDLTGNILTASGWKKICTDFHRKHPITALRCKESDTILAGQLAKRGAFNIYHCKNGLIDVAMPIIIDDIHIGNLYTGQFLFEKPDLDFFSEQAEEFGFEKAQYLDALSDVPIFSKDQIETAINYLSNMTVVIGSAGLDRKKLSDLNRDLEKEVYNRTEKLRRETIFSESLISSLPGVMYVFDQAGHFYKWNQNFEKITGYSKKQILEMSPLDFISPEDKSRIKEAITQVFQKGYAVVEAHFSTISGETIPFLFTGYKYTQEDVNYLIGVGIDISERVNAEDEKALLIEKLQETLSKVKKLSGLLPICSSCKNIRDDKGYWNQIESFIRDHSEAEFTHSICPACAKKLYPDIDVYKD